MQSRTTTEPPSPLAIVVAEHGGPEVLHVREQPRIPLGDADVRVAVRFVALNHLDLWVRRGVPGHDFHLPRIPGSDVAGVVVEAGPAARIGVGSEVALHPSWGCMRCTACLRGAHNRCLRFSIRGETVDGGCATELVVPDWHCLPRPAHLSLAHVAALPLTLLTSWHMLVARARLQRGEQVLVQAGASGVGVMAIQIAQLHGCDVHATASTAERRLRLTEMGVTAWRYEDIGARGSLARDFDVVVENSGAETWAASLRALAWGGRLVTCGATSGAEAAVNLRALFFKQQSLLGSTMGTAADMADAWREVRAGRITPVVDHIGAMSRIAEAHGILERREAVGKIVLEQDLVLA